MKKGYMAREGAFLTNWEIYDLTVLPTKKMLKEYMKNKLGFGCPKSRRAVYAPDEDIHENKIEEYGYEIVTVNIVEKGDNL